MNEFDEYARNYHRELDHILRRIVDSSGDYFIQLKCDELETIAAAYNLHPSACNILDVGCGIGDFERLLPKSFGQKISLDLSYEMLRVAKCYEARDKAEYFNASALTIPLKNESVDLIFASCVLHHISPVMVPLALQEMRRVCKPDGVIVYFEHNPWNPLTQLVVKTTPLDRGAKLISSTKMKRMMELADLRVVNEQYILFGPKWIDIHLRKLFGVYMSRMPIGGQYFLVATKC